MPAGAKVEARAGEGGGKGTRVGTFLYNKPNICHTLPKDMLHDCTLQGGVGERLQKKKLKEIIEKKANMMRKAKALQRWWHQRHARARVNASQ